MPVKFTQSALEVLSPVNITAPAATRFTQSALEVLSGKPPETIPPAQQEIFAVSLVDCISVANSDYGMEVRGPVRLTTFRAAAALNTIARSTFDAEGSIREYDTKAITADPFTDAANGNFDLNDDPSGGQVMKNTEGIEFTP